MVSLIPVPVSDPDSNAMRKSRKQARVKCAVSIQQSDAKLPRRKSGAEMFSTKSTLVRHLLDQHNINLADSKSCGAYRSTNFSTLKCWNLFHKFYWFSTESPLPAARANEQGKVASASKEEWNVHPEFFIILFRPEFSHQPHTRRNIQFEWYAQYTFCIRIVDRCSKWDRGRCALRDASLMNTRSKADSTTKISLPFGVPWRTPTPRRRPSLQSRWRFPPPK